MANNLFISYDLMAPGQHYDRVIEAIKALGSWARVHYSLYYVNSSLTAAEACNRVWGAMDRNDRIIVIDTTNNAAAWQGLPDEVGQHIRDNWYR